MPAPPLHDAARAHVLDTGRAGDRTADDARPPHHRRRSRRHRIGLRAPGAGAGDRRSPHPVRARLRPPPDRAALEPPARHQPLVRTQGRGRQRDRRDRPGDVGPARQDGGPTGLASARRHVRSGAGLRQRDALQLARRRRGGVRAGHRQRVHTCEDARRLELGLRRRRGDRGPRGHRARSRPDGRRHLAVPAGRCAGVREGAGGERRVLVRGAARHRRLRRLRHAPQRHHGPARVR